MSTLPKIEPADATGAAAEVVGNLALNILTNYVNILADTDNEFPVVAPHEA
ncbi:hypothetical protein ACQPZA_14935 [Pseudonocardia xinjiangensis]|uniref:hypothetical protein n=1 Tax=Pseudonocardia xinjiangensis TaxID=75289 RepID=UPI003D8F2C5A